MPNLSIIIPSYSRADLLAACLHSIIKNSDTIHPQIIVVDDASADHRIFMAARSFPGVEVIRLIERSGFCAAINAGLTRAQADIIQVLNDDTEVTPGWHETPLQRFHDHPQLGSIAPLVLQWTNPGKIDSAGDGYDAGGYAYSRGRGEWLSERWLTGSEVFSAAGSAAFFRRNALRKVGGFPEDFIAYFDDIEVGFKLRQTGYTCWYEPQSRVLHHGSASLGKRPSRRLTEQLACNEERVFCRHLSSDNRWRQLTRHAVVLGAKALRRWADGTLVPFCMGRVKAWCETIRVKSGRSSISIEQRLPVGNSA
jgi:GT2 family glycosyltransferase